MKKLLLYKILSFLSIYSLAQADTRPYSPEGATWLYAQVSWWGVSRHLVVSYSHDSTVMGKTVKVMVTKTRKYSTPYPDMPSVLTEITPGPEYYFWHRDDSVSFFNDSTGNFELIYVFNHEVGDTLTIQPNAALTCDSTVLLPGVATVDSLTNEIYAGVLYKVLYYSEGSYYTMGGKILKNIGSFGSFLPEPTSGNCPQLDGAVGTGMVDFLECYHDGQRGTVAFRGHTAAECDVLLFSGVGIEESVSEKHTPEELPVFYPNPSTGTVFFNKPAMGMAGTAVLRVYDMMGRLLVTHRVNGDSIDLNLSSGIYFLELSTENRKHGQKMVFTEN